MTTRLPVIPPAVRKILPVAVGEKAAIRPVAARIPVVAWVQRIRAHPLALADLPATRPAAPRIPPEAATRVLLPAAASAVAASAT